MNKNSFIRPVFTKILERINEPRKFIQVLQGPRQVGKTTLVQQLVKHLSIPCHYASADESMLNQESWLEQQWRKARFLANHLDKHHQNSAVLLILDEIQKIDNWSGVVKLLWDADTQHNNNIKVILLGSSDWIMQQGLTESLAGRFETIAITHWSYTEMRQAFGFSLADYIYFGGYPGAADLIHDELRWQNYILNSLIDTTISRDILLMTRIDKPALLKKLFEFGCHYSSQEISLQKILGQLQEKGNATTISHYLDLLAAAGILCGLEKYSSKVVTKKSSSPKLQVYNTALISAVKQIRKQDLFSKPEILGRHVESAVAAHLLNTSRLYNIGVYYWRDANYEIDYVISDGTNTLGIEVKSGLQKHSSGYVKFKENFPNAKTMMISDSTITLEEFLSFDAGYWLNM